VLIALYPGTDNRFRVVLSQPLIAHDLNEVRRIALHELSAPFPEEQQYVDEATEVFFNVRSDVSDNLYSDSIECLEWFHNLGVKVGVLTNGSADLTKSVALNNLLSLKLTAGEVGCSKPSPVGFMACAQVRSNAVVMPTLSGLPAGPCIVLFFSASQVNVIEVCYCSWRMSLRVALCTSATPTSATCLARTRPAW
jgi:hypothetical protein